MSISDVLRGKGHHVAKVRTTDTVQAVVRKLSEERIGAVVVEDQWMRLAGIFSERDFVNAVAEHGAQALSFSAEKLDERASCDVPLERSGGNRDGGDDDGEDQTLAGCR